MHYILPDNIRFEMLVSGRHHAKEGDHGGDDHGGHGHSHFTEFVARSRAGTMKVTEARSRAGTRVNDPPHVNFTTLPVNNLEMEEMNDQVTELGFGRQTSVEYDAMDIRPSTVTLDMDGAVLQLAKEDRKMEHQSEAAGKKTEDDNGKDSSKDEENKDNIFVKIAKECIPERTLGWMVIAGDGVHNLIDGIAVGAAFSGDIVSGISTSVAIVCHEIPHEVGDFAALLTSGVSYRGAIIWNIIHSFLALAGLYIGLAIGDDDASRQWIFALTSGMFIYVALTEMMPELTKIRGKFWTYFFFQNVGLLFGFAIMLLIAIFEDAMVSLMAQSFSSGSA